MWRGVCVGGGEGRGGHDAHEHSEVVGQEAVVVSVPDVDYGSVRVFHRL